MALKRSLQKRLTQLDALRTRAENGIRKKRERARRELRILQIVKAGHLPYSPAVMSWLSRKLDKKAGRITPEDIKILLS